MRTDEDENAFLMREFDSTRAIRGRFAYLFTPEQRDTFLRDAPFDDEQNWLRIVRTSFDGLGRAIFAHRVLVGGETPRRAAVRSGALHDSLCHPELARRLARLRVDWDWIAPTPPGAGRSERLGWIQRMGRILTEVGEVQADLQEEIRLHLAGGGLTPGEIERRTEEAARQWRAA
jgi:hypothetical protein